jgi:S1-C subfamily serine protease
MKKQLVFAAVVGAVVGAQLAQQLTDSTGRWTGAAVAHAQPPGLRPVPRRTTPVPDIADSRSGERTNYTPEEAANIRVYEVANSSVVNINTSTVQYDRFFMLPIPGEGSGSGSILDRQGHILTNFHVIEGAEEIEVTLANGNTYPASLVGFDEETDISVLKIDAPAGELQPITIGASSNLKVGQRVYALGNPFGLSGTLTTGIISSLNRNAPGAASRRALESLIQTDAAMNPGNSGGPLLDTNAHLIGMNIAIASKTGQSAGVGFAIPANRIRRIVPELIEHGKVIRPDHGIVSVMPTQFGLKIVKLIPGGPAEKAELRGFRIRRERRVEGSIIYQREYIDRAYADTIVGVNGTPTRTHNEFLDVIEKYKPGDTVNFTIIREGREMTVPVTLGEA